MKSFDEVENYLATKKDHDEVYQKRQKNNDNFIYEK